MTEHRSVPDLRDAAGDLRTLPCVIVADVISEDPRHPRAGHTLDVTLHPDVRRLPPSVLRTLADHDLDVGTAQPQGDPPHYCFVAF